MATDKLQYIFGTFPTGVSEYIYIHVYILKIFEIFQKMYIYSIVYILTEIPKNCKLSIIGVIITVSRSIMSHDNYKISAFLINASRSSSYARVGLSP